MRFILRNYHYRKDLKRYDHVLLEKVDINSLPRLALVKNAEFFPATYRLLREKGATAQKAYELLSLLPIHPTIYEQIIRLPGIRGCDKPDWAQLLNPSA